MIRRLDEATLAADELPRSPETETEEGALEDLNHRIHQALDKVRFDVSASQFIQERLASIDPRFAPQQKITELRETHERLNLILLEAVNKLEQDFMRLGVDPDMFESGFKHFQLAKKIVAENMGKQSTDLRLEKATLLEKTRQARSIALREKMYPTPPAVREEELVPSVEPEAAPVVPDTQEQITAPTESFLQFQQHVSENWDKQIDNETIVELRKIAPALTEAELVALTSTMEKQLPPEVFGQVEQARHLLEEAKHSTSQEDLDAVLQKRNDLMEAFASAVKDPETAKAIRTIAEQYTNDKFKEHLLSAWDERLDKDVFKLLAQKPINVKTPEEAKALISKKLPIVSKDLLEQVRLLAKDIETAPDEEAVTAIQKRRNQLIEQFATTLQPLKNEIIKSKWLDESVQKVQNLLALQRPDLVAPATDNDYSLGIVHVLEDRLNEDAKKILSKLINLTNTADWSNKASIYAVNIRRDKLINQLNAIFVNDKDNGLLPATEKDPEAPRRSKKQMRGEAKSEIVKAKLRKNNVPETELAETSAMDIADLEKFEAQTWATIEATVGKNHADLFHEGNKNLDEISTVIPPVAVSRMREIENLIIALEHSSAPRVQQAIKEEVNEAIEAVREAYANKGKEHAPYFDTLDEIYGEFYEVAKKAGSDESRRKLDTIFADFIQYEKGSVEEIPASAKEALLDAVLKVYKTVNGHEYTHQAYFGMKDPKDRKNTGGQAIIKLVGHLKLRSYLALKMAQQAETPKTDEAATPAEAETEQKVIRPEMLAALDQLRSTLKLANQYDPQMIRLYTLAETSGKPSEWHPEIKDEIISIADELLYEEGINPEFKALWNNKVARLDTLELNSALFKQKKGIDEKTLEYLREHKDKLFRKLSPVEEQGLGAMQALRAVLDVQESTPASRAKTAISVSDIEKMLLKVGRPPASDTMQNKRAA